MTRTRFRKTFAVEYQLVWVTTADHNVLTLFESNPVNMNIGTGYEVLGLGYAVCSMQCRCLLYGTRHRIEGVGYEY